METILYEYLLYSLLDMPQAQSLNSPQAGLLVSYHEQGPVYSS